MDAIKHYLGYIVLIALFWATVVFTPKFARVQVPPGYNDIDDIVEYTSYRLDKSVTIPQLASGDAVCYRLGSDSESETFFGWIAALPGDEIQVAAGNLLVNGEPLTTAGAANLQLPASAPLCVPANHFFVISSSHQYDSIAQGPLPATALRGRLGSLP